MKNYSIWLENFNDEVCKPLDKDIEVDVLIIGGGITGISIAYELRNSNLKVALVEKNRVGMGVTARTTGKLTFLQELIYSDLTKTYNFEVAEKYLKSQVDAIKNVKNIIKKENINCDYNEVKSYVYTNNEKEIKKIKSEKELLEKMGVDVSVNRELPDGTPISYGISVSNTGVFHPLKYLENLKNICLNHNMNIYENTIVIDIRKDNDYFLCKTSEHTIKAKKVVLALHYPYFLFPYLFPFKVTLEKSYVAAYKTNTNYLYSAITSKKPTISNRFLDLQKDIFELLLINSHNIAFSNNDQFHFQDLLKRKPLYVWSNKDILTSDKIPFIGEISPNLYLSTGYNTWGMTNGSLAGIIIKDLINGNNNPYKELFNPKRGLNKNSIIKFPVTLVSTVKSFGGSKINKNKSWYNPNVKFVKKDGKSLGIYKDDLGKEHIVYNICPHLKCSLIFNEVEKTWDCPCHGSRFDIDGHSIEGPSNFDISYKK